MLHAHSILAIPGHENSNMHHAPHISIASPHTQENWKEEYNVKDFILLLITPKLNKYSHPLFTVVNWFLFALSLISVVALVLATDTHLMSRESVRVALFSIDAVCVGFFTIEYALLVYSIPSRKSLLKSSYVICLLCKYPSLIPSYSSVLSRSYYRSVTITL
jgi:hypothetical protein